MSKAKITLTIEEEVLDEIKHIVTSSQGLFNSINEYIEFILTELVSEEGSEDSAQLNFKIEEKNIKNRLRELGYL